VRRSWIWLALGLLAAAAAIGAVALRGPAAASTPADQVHEIATSLRCPVCRDLSVADSPAPLAQEMRDTIARRLQAGRTADQIRAEFVAAYGESILLTPPRRGIGLVAWLAPAVLVGAGLVVGLAAVRRWRSRPATGRTGDGAARPARLPASDRRLLERALARLDEEERA
jgi:cytochrome c-type biogenesis protein CcmH